MARFSRKHGKLRNNLMAIVQRDGKKMWLKTKSGSIIIFNFAVYLLSFLAYINVFPHIFYFCKYFLKPRTFVDNRFTYRRHVTYTPSYSEQIILYFRSDEGKKRKLLSWVKSKVPTRHVNDFTTSWTDGITLCALINEIIKGSCPRYDLLNPNHRVNNCRLGLRLAFKELGLQEPMTPEQMADSRLIMEDKVYAYILSLKCASQIPVQPKDEKQAVVAAKGGKVDYKEKCTAAGSGLHIAVVGLRAKFDIMTRCNQLQDLSVRVVDPKNEEAKVKIVNDKAGRGFLRDFTAGHQIRPQKAKIPRGEGSISLDYQCIKDGQFQVSYVPVNIGIHEISIVWDGDHIRNSPFQVNVTNKEEAPREKKTVSFEDERSVLLRSDPTKTRRQSLLRQHKMAMSESSCDIDSISPQSSVDRHDYPYTRRYQPAKLGRADSLSSRGSLASTSRQAGGIRTRRKVIRRIISSSQGSTDKNLMNSFSSTSMDSVDGKDPRKTVVLGKDEARKPKRALSNALERYADKTARTIVEKAFNERPMLKTVEVKKETREVGKRQKPKRSLSKEEIIEEASENLLQKKLSQYKMASTIKNKDGSSEDSFDRPVPLSPTDDEDEPVTNMLLRKKMERYGPARDEVLQGGRRMDMKRTLSVEEAADKLFQQKVSEYKAVSQEEKESTASEKEKKKRQVPSNLVLDNRAATTPSPSEKSSRSPLTKMKSFGKIFDTDSEEPPTAAEDVKFAELTIRTICEDEAETETNVADDEKRQGWPLPLTPIRESSQELMSPPSAEKSLASAPPFPGSQATSFRRPNLDDSGQGEKETDPTPEQIKRGADEAKTAESTVFDPNATVEIEVLEQNGVAAGATPKNLHVPQEDTHQEIDSGYHSDQLLNISRVSSLDKVVRPTPTKPGDNIRARQSKTITPRKIKVDKETQCSAKEIKKETGWRSRKESFVSKVTISLQTDLEGVDSLPVCDSRGISDGDRKGGSVDRVSKRSPKHRKKHMRQSTFDSGFSDENGLVANGGTTSQGASSHGISNETFKHNFDDLESFFSMTKYDEEMALAYMTKMLESSFRDDGKKGAKIYDDGDSFSPAAELGGYDSRYSKSPKLSETEFSFSSSKRSSQNTSYEADWMEPETPTGLQGEIAESQISSGFSGSRGEVSSPENNAQFIDRLFTERGFENRYDEWTELFASLDAENSQDSISVDEGHRNRSSISDALELADDDKIPKSSKCKASGVGLASGYVGARNNFQVNTEKAGNGSLTVGVVGPQPNSVTETAVVYTGDDMYEVDYEVSRPGCYVITVKWADMNIPSSPFISHITY